MRLSRYTEHHVLAKTLTHRSGLWVTTWYDFRRIGLMLSVDKHSLRINILFFGFEVEW